jgi:hypothetical protein
MSEETEAVKETAIAVQEAAKTTSNALDAGRELGGFVARFISGPLEQGFGIIEDKLRFTRWERQQRLIHRAEQFMHEQGIGSPDNPIPLKNAVPLLEYATLEEDDNLQDMWARLIVNGVNEASGINMERSFIEILAQISPIEAQILNTIYAIPFEEANHSGIVTGELPENAALAEETPRHGLSEPSDEVKLALANLVRIGCITFPTTWGGVEIYTSVNPTFIGKMFVEACSFK